jgi:hypothetical protein
MDCFASLAMTLRGYYPYPHYCTTLAPHVEPAVRFTYLCRNR